MCNLSEMFLIIGTRRKTSVEEFLGQEASSPLLVLGVDVPDLGPHDIFRSHKARPAGSHTPACSS